MTPVNSADDLPEAGRYREEKIRVYENGSAADSLEPLIAEEPLSICIEGAFYSVVMRSPGEEKAHAAGFCLSEGIVARPEDFAAIGFCREAGTDTASVALQPERRKIIKPLLQHKKTAEKKSSCICDELTAAAPFRAFSPPADSGAIGAEQVLDCADRLSGYQSLHKKTRSAHAAMILDEKLGFLSFSEDVGRHNALDKAVGRVFLDGSIDRAAVAVMSSRLAFELVQKAACAQIAVMVGISKPTALAVDFARRTQMTLCCVKNRRLMVFCGAERIYF
ncbi:MAG: formate dehydrogenase accessory sulfurtransferase FdhD [Desulfosalsimonadaceae bacterium]